MVRPSMRNARGGWGLLLLLLAACAPRVPEPVRYAGGTDRGVPAASWHNVAPPNLLPGRAVALADVNGDGHPDLLVGGRKDAPAVRLFLGDGRGRWQLAPSPPSAMQPEAIAVADLDGDGAPEVVLAGSGDEKGVQVWKWRKGNWRRAKPAAERGVFHDLAVADFNGDGWPDLAAAGEDGLFVWLNDAAGGWVAHAGPVRRGRHLAVVARDFDGDGDVDLVAARADGLGATKRGAGAVARGGVEFWWNEGDARFKRETLPTRARPLALAAGDLAGGGRPALVVGFARGGIAWWTRRDDGRLRMHRVARRGTWPAVAVGDLDGDGAPELVAASGDGRGLHAWTRGEAAHAWRGPLPRVGFYTALALGDVMGRGGMDVAAARTSGAPELWSPRQAAPFALVRTDEELVAEAVVFFPSGSDALAKAEQAKLASWWKQLRARFSNDLHGLRLELIGKADPRPIHTKRFPDNIALSRARAEAAARWLLAHGAPKDRLSIRALGAKEPEPPGFDPEALRLNRRVRVRALRVHAARILPGTEKVRLEDLYHVRENRVFRTIRGRPLYKVGPGDEITIVLWRGGKSKKHELVVQPDGTVSLPYMERVRVAGLASVEIEARLTRMLRRYEKHPRVDVYVRKKRAHVVTILGEVQNLVRQPTGPGAYPLLGRETLVDFLSRVGGPTRDADLAHVQLIRGGRTILLNLEKAISQGDWTQNAVLDEGDRVIIPSLRLSKRRVYVLGEVNKPGVVEFSGELRFLDAIAKAGGFGRHPYYASIRVIRAADERTPEIIPVAFDRLLEEGDVAQNLALEDHDIVIVPRSPIGNWNAFIQDLLPTFQLLTQPLTAVQELLLIRDLNRRVRR